MKNLMAPVVRDSMKEFANECQADWPALGRMKVFMTGGTGFYGSWVLAGFIALRDAGVPIEMTVLSRNPETFLSENPLLRQTPGLTFMSGDVAKSEVPRGTTHVFHFATTPTDRALDGGDSSESEQNMKRTIVDGTKHMLAESVRVKAKRFVLASSGAVYGEGKTDRPREDELILPRPLDPSVKLSVYGKAKRDAEGFCFEASRLRSIETVITRGFSFGGPLFPLDAPYALSSFMKAMLAGEKMVVKNPTTVRSFLDGRDLARVLWKLMVHGRPGEAYNIGSDDSVSMLGLAKEIQTVAKNMGRPVPEIETPTEGSAASGAPKGDVYRPQIEKLSRHFGWRPQVSLRESLKAFAEWAAD